MDPALPTRFNERPLKAPLRLAAPSGTSVRHWTCPGCVYDLHGLPAQGSCPECGMAYTCEELHVHGWRYWYRVPVGPRARARLLAMSCVAAFFLGTIGLRVLGQAVTPQSVVWAGLVLMVPLVLLGWFEQSRALATRPRPMRVHLTPSHVHVTGVWVDRAIPWSRFSRARVRRKIPGFYELVLTAPLLDRVLREILPWEAGLWRVNVYFPGTQRDAALVRRLVRRAIEKAERCDGGQSLGSGEFPVDQEH